MLSGRQLQSLRAAIINELHPVRLDGCYQDSLFQKKTSRTLLNDAK